MVYSRPTKDTNTPVAQAETADERQHRVACEAQRIEASDASIDAGRLISLSAVSAWIDSVDTRNELPPPRAR
jgi:predicted transcriptional regulator